MSNSPIDMANERRQNCKRIAEQNIADAERRRVAREADRLQRAASQDEQQRRQNQAQAEREHQAQLDLVNRRCEIVRVLEETALEMGMEPVPAEAMTFFSIVLAKLIP